MDNDATTEVGDSKTSTDQDVKETTSTAEVGTTDDKSADNSEQSDQSDDATSGDMNDDAATDDSKTQPKFDKDLDEWAKRTHRPVPTTDEERQSLQDIRDDQRSYARSREGKEVAQGLGNDIEEAGSEFKSDGKDGASTDAVDQLRQELQLERDTRLRSEYFSEAGVTQAEADAMVEFLKEEKAKGGKEAYDFWVKPQNLSKWHQLAKANLPGKTDDVIVTEAQRLERERIAKESQAGPASRGAKSTVTNEEKSFNDKLREKWGKAPD